MCSVNHNRVISTSYTQDPLAVTVVAAYLGVQACKSSSGSWQAHLKDVPTVDGSSCCFVSNPLPTAAAAAQQYDKLVIALLGRGYVAEGTNVNFAPEEYTDEVRYFAGSLETMLS